MTSLQDHPLRYPMANELHARPFPTISAPGTVIFFAVKKPSEAVARDRSKDVEHLVALLDRHGQPHPKPGATHHSARLGRYELKWEQHTEFVSYMLYCDGVGDRAFDPADFNAFPADWMAEAPGQIIASAMIRVMERPDDALVRRNLENWLVPESLTVSRVLGDSAIVAGDFRIDAAGQMRFAVYVSEGTGPKRVGRIVQRLCEIETYRAMSMLGFSRARGLMPTIGALDNHLTDMMQDMTGQTVDAEATLKHLLTVSAELESLGARSSFRFGATGAYQALVNQRVELLREERFQGFQTFAEFMIRRYDPAMRTVTSTEARLVTLADRARRAGELLRTRVDVERSAQNQALLESMDRRADLALRLQHTVEGLSVVAISYYAVSLASYALYPLTKAFGISKGTLTAAVTLPVILLVWWMVQRVKKSLH